MKKSVSPKSSLSVEEKSLLENICRNPHDLELRFVYADHLIERGDVRGEHAQMQCQLAAKPENLKTLLVREYELREQAEKKWREVLAVPRGTDFSIRRGVIEEIQVPIASYQNVLRYRDILPISSVSFRDGDTDSLVKALNDSELKTFREFTFDGVPFGRKGPKAFVESECFENAIRLKFQKNGIGPAGIEVLMKGHAVAPNIVEFELHDNGMHWEGMSKIVQKRSWASQLQSLSLCRVNVHEGWSLLAKGHLSQALRRLVIAGASIYEPGMLIADAISNCSILSQLDELTVHTMGMGTSDLLKLLSVKNCYPRLLNFNGNRIGPKVVSELFETSMMKQVESLDLRHNNLGDRGANALLKTQLPSTLKCLYLTGNEISNEIWKKLEDTFAHVLVPNHVLDMPSLFDFSLAKPEVEASVGEESLKKPKAAKPQRGKVRAKK